MKILLVNLIIFGCLIRGTAPMLQMAMKIAGEQILQLLVKAALNAVTNTFYTLLHNE